MHHQQARLHNLSDYAFLITRVIATTNLDAEIGQKSAAIQALQPLAVVDDYLPYWRGIPKEIHVALIRREPNDSPNTGDDLALTHSQHVDLAAFAEWCLQSR